MDEQAVKEIVDEIFSSLEPLDTQGSALLQFLKDKGIANDEELAPYLEQAGKASSVRWLAARVRIKGMIASAMKTEKVPAERPAESEDAKDKKSAEPVAESGLETPRAYDASAVEQDSPKSDGKVEAPAEASDERSESQKEGPPADENEEAKREAA